MKSKLLHMVIVDNGDGSQSNLWVNDMAVITAMEKLADDGDERYASGDGLQVTTLVFPDDFDLDAWIRYNPSVSITGMEDLE